MISNSKRLDGPYICDGRVTQFPFFFKIFNKEDISVVVSDSNGSESVISQVSDYSVSMNKNQDSSPGGFITTNSAIPNGKVLVITSGLEFLQGLQITNGGAFYPSVINDALDKLTIYCQQLLVDVKRSVKVPVTGTLDVDKLLSNINSLGEISDSIRIAANNIADIANAPESAQLAIESAAQSSVSASVSSSAATSVLSIAASISKAQAAANALLGLGIGTSYLDTNGHLIMAYEENLASVSIDSNGHLNVSF